LLKKALWISALASALAVITSSTAVALAVVVKVSGPSPLSACTSLDAIQAGRVFLDAEVEPFIGVNPANPANWVTMWHQDRWSNGGAHGIGVGVTTTGGTTWTESTLPVSKCAPGTPANLQYLRASDPWVSFGPDGTAYASALSFNQGSSADPALGIWANAVAAVRSTNGGATWDHAQPIPGSVFGTAQAFGDKNSTTANPVLPGTAYTVWDTLILATDRPDDNPHAQAYRGDAYFSKTTDGGITWSQAKVIIKTANRQQTIGNIIVVDPLHPNTLYDFADLIVPPNTPFQGTRSKAVLVVVKSTDGGNTWTAPKVIAPFNSLGVHDPNTCESLRVGDGLEEVAIDPTTGKLYVVWESSTRYQKQLKQSSCAWDDEILLSSSSDGGATWTAPSVVHKLASGLPTFTPMVAVNGGRVAVTFYDNSNLLPGQTANLPTDYWVKYSTDGGVTFGNAEHIAGSFDARTAPVARGYFLGDYEGLMPSGAGFAAVFVMTNCVAPYPASNPLCAPASSNLAPTTNTNPTDVFVALLT
jgi:hypothetical protein